MIPGEVITKDGDIELNQGAAAITLEVSARTIISSRPTRPCASTGPGPGDTGSTSPLAPRSASSPASAVR